MSKQGYSKATPVKQATLDKELGHILGSALRVAKHFRVCYTVADMTAGSGIDPFGQDGSPLIIAKHLSKLITVHNYPVNFLLAERNGERMKHLQRLMAERFPGLDGVHFFDDQRELLEAVPKSSYGVTYWDPDGYNTTPTKWDALSASLLSHVGERFKTMDILITRQAAAWVRMIGAAHCKDKLSLQEYLATMHKDRSYILPYVPREEKSNKWAFGFGSNWEDRPVDKMWNWLDLQRDKDAETYFEEWLHGGILLPRGIERQSLWDQMTEN